MNFIKLFLLKILQRLEEREEKRTKEDPPIIILPQRLEAIFTKIGYTEEKRSLLPIALTHNSSTPGVLNYQRLEFLGDAVLSLVAAESLYDHHPGAREGLLTNERARLVCEKALARVAQALSLEKVISVGNGSQRLRESRSVTADVVEALIGAVHKDMGYEAAREFSQIVLELAGGLREKKTIRPVAT